MSDSLKYWQDLAVANRKVAEEAQAQRDKLEKALKVAAEMLASHYFCDSSPAEVLEFLITRAREMK